MISINNSFHLLKFGVKHDFSHTINNDCSSDFIKRFVRKSIRLFKVEKYS